MKWVVWQHSYGEFGVNHEICSVHDSEIEGLMAAAQERDAMRKAVEEFEALAPDFNVEDEQLEWEIIKNPLETHFYLEDNVISVSKTEFYGNGEFIAKIHEEGGANAVQKLQARAENSTKNCILEE